MQCLSCRRPKRTSSPYCFRCNKRIRERDQRAIGQYVAEHVWYATPNNAKSLTIPSTKGA